MSRLKQSRLGLRDPFYEAQGIQLTTGLREERRLSTSSEGLGNMEKTCIYMYTSIYACASGDGNLRAVSRAFP